MIAPDWFRFGQDLDRPTPAQEDGACWLHLRLTVSATVALHRAREMRDLGVTTIADHDILDVIKILADISGKKACTA
jgi:hypothetical protein